MEADFNLYKHILGVVDKQIEESDPPKAREVYEKLINSGDDENTAKEKIASIIAEEMYYLLLDENKSFNQDRYIEKLDHLV